MSRKSYVIKLTVVRQNDQRLHANVTLYPLINVMKYPKGHIINHFPQLTNVKSSVFFYLDEDQDEISLIANQHLEFHVNEYVSEKTRLNKPVQIFARISEDPVPPRTSNASTFPAVNQQVSVKKMDERLAAVEKKLSEFTYNVQFVKVQESVVKK